MRNPIVWLLTAVLTSCHQGDPSSRSATALQAVPSAKEATYSNRKQSDSKGDGYVPPTAEEMAPMRPAYLAELAKIHEPPEMAEKPMQGRRSVSPRILELNDVMTSIGSPEKATHERRATAIRDLLEIANSNVKNDGFDRAALYGAIAAMACIDRAEPRTVIEYASNATGGDDDALALRARMYLTAGDLGKALDDLEEIMARGNGHALVGGDVDPRKESASCGWSIADFDALGDDPRALAAKGLYLSSFISYGAANRGTVKESRIRELYAQSARSWHSPIPRVLAVSLDGLGGSEHSIAGSQCIRGSGGVQTITDACSKYDDGIRRNIRELTMAIVIEPAFARALSARANKYLQLAQGAYADGKPSRELFELAIKDFTAAIAAGGKDQHTLYCDQALAQASLGRHHEAISGYIEGMKYAKNGVEESPFVYEQLAGLYMRTGKYNEAAHLMTRAIINASGGGMDVVIFSGGLRAFRTLYPEYDLLPDDILAEAIRRRYHPQFPQTWDAGFISKPGPFDGKIASSILPNLYVLRGDAYAKAGRRAEAEADYRRVKSDAWAGKEPYLPRMMYFNERGERNYELPEPWPPLPPHL